MAAKQLTPHGPCPEEQEEGGMPCVPACVNACRPNCMAKQAQTLGYGDCDDGRGGSGHRRPFSAAPALGHRRAHLLRFAAACRAVFGPIPLCCRLGALAFASGRLLFCVGMRGMWLVWHLCTLSLLERVGHAAALAEAWLLHIAELVLILFCLVPVSFVVRVRWPPKHALGKEKDV
eukprot:1158927-Pelagomonas_calceolata.AAC.13